MINQAMARKLEKGEAIDVSIYRQPDGVYYLPDFIEGKDYCDAQRELWIWSIGRCKTTRTIMAAVDGRFYDRPDFTCLWLR